MKQHLYRVLFNTGLFDEVWAFGEEEARIIAQARQIEKGNRYTVEGVTFIR
jgi:hypothetical protein